MKAAPEEFYSRCPVAPVTPQNAENFLMCVRSWRKTHTLEFECDCMELWSGCARTTYTAMKSGLHVVCPIDARYGWNLELASHRRLVSMIIAELKPTVLLCAMECTAWPVSAN